MHVMSSKLVLSGQYNGLIGAPPAPMQGLPQHRGPNAGAGDANPHTDVHEQPAVKAVIT